jgi:hypothetical protein
LSKAEVVLDGEALLLNCVLVIRPMSMIEGELLLTPKPLSTGTVVLVPNVLPLIMILLVDNVEPSSIRLPALALLGRSTFEIELKSLLLLPFIVVILPLLLLIRSVLSTALLSIGALLEPSMRVLIGLLMAKEVAELLNTLLMKALSAEALLVRALPVRALEIVPSSEALMNSRLLLLCRSLVATGLLLTSSVLLIFVLL